MTSPGGACVVCRYGATRPATTTLILQRGSATVVFNDVPARVCDNCGEDYVDEEVAERALPDAESAAHAGVRLEQTPIRHLTGARRWTLSRRSM